jgi:hypothetical protein
VGAEALPRARSAAVGDILTNTYVPLVAPALIGMTPFVWWRIAMPPAGLEELGR